MSKENPGKVILAYGMLGLCIFVIGGAVGGGARTPDIALLWTTLVILWILITVSSVVGAYYAGKGRR